jgi:hypothetical protein
MAAALCVTVALETRRGASAGQLTAADAAAHPAIDTDFLYQQLYYSSTQFIGRFDKADGSRTDPSDPNNLPRNYNGTNEYFAWWKSAIADSSNDHMGPLGSFVTVKDHFFTTGPLLQPGPQLDDATATIPGQSCPAQVVMVSGHPDNQATFDPSPGTSLTPMTSMHSGNWGNGAPYEGSSGVAMSMAELQGLLRWYQANGTYPSRTIKVALLDGELGGLLGSTNYTQTDAPATLLAPAAQGDLRVYESSTLNLGGGQTVVVDPFGSGRLVTTVVTVGAGPRTATTLAAASNAGDTVIYPAAVTNLVVGEKIAVDTGASREYDTIQSIGTAGAGGTGVTLTAPLAASHPAGATTQDIGAGMTLSDPLSAAVPFGAQVIGPTNNGLIPAGPQGQYVMAAYMDSNGLEYPAFHWGTQNYLNDITGGTVGPWFTNINAAPLAANGQYPASSVAWARIVANMPAVTAFRDALIGSVNDAFAALGQKYNFSVPLENPLRLDQVGSTPINPTIQSVPAYTPGDAAKYSPVQDDATGRTDIVPFINRGIPGYDVLGAYDTSTNNAVGGSENPYPTSYPSKPTITQYGGLDTSDDTIQHLNYFASGTTHGPGGVDQPSEGLRRALELPATWTDYLIQRSDYGGADPKSTGPVAYFETVPARPASTNVVTFDASFSRGAAGSTTGLKYFWDFGDGTTLATKSQTIVHTFPAGSSQWYDVKLVVGRGASLSFYRQALPVLFTPAVYPATPAPGEPAPPATDPCGTLTSDEQAQIAPVAREAFGSIAAQISIAPDGASRAGEPQTFTVTLKKNAGGGLSTTLSSAASAGATNIKVASVTGLDAGQTLTLDTAGANPETVTATAVGTPGSAGTGVTFTPALVFGHASGTAVIGGDVFTAAAGEHVDVTLADANGATHTAPTGTCTGLGANTDANGQCTLTFTSSTAGKVIGHAAATLSAGGPVTVATDGISLNSSDAVASFASAQISIGPDGTNVAGIPHSFTVTLQKNSGGASTRLAAPSSAGDTNIKVATTTGLSAGQTLTLDPAGAAHETVTIAEVGTGGVDGTGITIAPAAGSAHQSGAVVTAGGALEPAAAEHVDVTLSNSNGATHTSPTGTCTQAGANTDSAGKCTITFSSPTAGTVTGHASSALSVAGLPAFTVETDGSSPNSVDAVKTFVDVSSVAAQISIAPDASNRVGQPHTFTVMLQEKAVGGPSTTLAAAANAGDTNIKVASVAGYSIGQQVKIDSGAGAETRTLAAVGTAGAGGTGLTLTSALGLAHASGAAVSGVSAFVPAQGEHVDVTLTNSNGATHSAPSGTCTGAGPNTDASGQCTITFSSPTTGKVTGHASSSLTVSGVPITVQTGTAPSSADAVKTFVDAKIAITSSAAKEVGQAQTFTVALMKDTGDGTGFHGASGEHVDVTLTDSSGAAHTAPSGTCTGAGANTDSGGQCTITFSSPAVGKVTGHASSALSVGGSAPFTVATDGTAPSSGDATVEWVDARVSLTPLSATNAVGANHVVTATVEVNSGSGFSTAGTPAGTVVTFSLTNGNGAAAAGPATCAISGGTCSTTITSATAGTTQIHATASVDVAGTYGHASVTRSTGDSHAVDGPDVTKLWVATHVLDGSSTEITNGSTPAPATVHDTLVTFSGTAGSPPGGTATFTLYDNGTCNGNVVGAPDTENVVAGVATSSSTVPALAPAATQRYSYRAVYNGSPGAYPAADPICEVFTVSGGKVLAYGGSMEGDLNGFLPGSYVNAGYQLKLSKKNRAPVNVVVSGTIDLPVWCNRESQGAPAGTISVPVTASVTIPAGEPGWYPPDDPKRDLSWQGSVRAPDLCAHTQTNPTGLMYNRRGASSNVTVAVGPHDGTVSFRWKYSVPAGKNKPNTNCLDSGDKNSARSDICGSHWSLPRDP